MKGWAPILCITLCIILLLIGTYIFKNREGFATDTSQTNVSLENVPNEIFLVAPKANNFDMMTAPDSYPFTSIGYTYNEAVAVCSSIPGCTLANKNSTSQIPLSLMTALDLSGNWCAPGWVADDSINAYFPVSGSKKNVCKSSQSNPSNAVPPTGGTDAKLCTDTNGTPIPSIGSGKYCIPTSKGLGVYRVPNGEKAFAICMGPKPTGYTTNVNYFNSDSYSMYNTQMITYLTTGKDSGNPVNNDIFPITFSYSEAIIALEKAKDGTGVSTPYNIMNARKYLISSHKTDTIKKVLYPSGSETAAQRTSINSDIIGVSCTNLQTTYVKIDEKLNTIKGLYKALSQLVDATSTAKGESIVLQQNVQTLCNKNTLTVEQRDACERLLSLDYDIFYKNNSSDPYVQSNIYISLQDLAFNLRGRQCELQQVLGSLQQILLSFIPASTTGSSTNSSVCVSTLNKLKQKYGNNMISQGKDSSGNPLPGVPIDCSTFFDSSGNYSSVPTTNNPPLTGFTIGASRSDIDYPNLGALKIQFQKLSPFMSSSDFKALMENLLAQLSNISLPRPLSYTTPYSINNNTNLVVDRLGPLFTNIENGN
jgi:hypothetical protein